MTTLPQGPPPEDPVPADAEAAVLAAAADVLEQAQPAEEASMELLDNARRLLLVHAHPDDETIGNGATMAMYAAQGAHVTLVTCTLGEEGEVLVPELEHLAAQQTDALGEHRIQELATAMEALGVRDHRFLGGPGRYRDSGMMGLPSNLRPDCFWQADLDEAAAHLVAVIRQVRPQVAVTYDETGGYGHPDHIQAHRVCMRAVELAADPAVHADLGEPWQVTKVYWNVLPRSWVQEGLDAMKEAGIDFFGVQSVDELPFVVPDEAVTTEVDAMAYVEAKLAAMRAHATQISVDGPFFALSNRLGQRVWGHEFYRLAHGELGPRPAEFGRETDLFDGLA
jgi:N-acetyl-1-D-myo-inositol-2-amino-2-deoxy-alpha-D-glucopyranoside deacetylase